MKGSIRQRSPGSWESTIDADRDPLGKRQRKYVTVPGTKSQAQRKLRELLSAMDRDIHISTEKILLRDWLNPAQLTRAVKSLGAKCGVPNLTVRSLRHFHASVILQSGQNPVVVSKRLGHANVSITSDIYAHSLPDWQKQAADAFAEAMNADNADQNADNADSRRQSP